MLNFKSQMGFHMTKVAICDFEGCDIAYHLPSVESDTAYFLHEPSKCKRTRSRSHLYIESIAPTTHSRPVSPHYSRVQPFRYRQAKFYRPHACVFHRPRLPSNRENRPHPHAVRHSRYSFVANNARQSTQQPPPCTRQATCKDAVRAFAEAEKAITKAMRERDRQEATAFHVLFWTSVRIRTFYTSRVSFKSAFRRSGSARPALLAITCPCRERMADVFPFL